MSDMESTASNMSDAAATDKQALDDWFALLVEIANIDPSEEEDDYHDKDDPDFQEYYDPWEGLRVIKAELATLRKRAEELEAALLPFAKMDRGGCDLNEIALSRGVASDLTLITSRNFRTARDVLRLRQVDCGASNDVMTEAEVRELCGSCQTPVKGCNGKR